MHRFFFSKDKKEMPKIPPCSKLSFDTLNSPVLLRVFEDFLKFQLRTGFMCMLFESVKILISDHLDSLKYQEPAQVVNGLHSFCSFGVFHNSGETFF